MLSLEQFKDVCREAGLKVTHQRLEIYRELAETNEHPSAEAVFHKVRAKLPTISLDTVYRTLAAFDEIGAATRVDGHDNKARFDADVSPHHHFLCTRCKRIFDVVWEEFDLLEPPPEVERLGKVMAKGAIFKGICRGCLPESN